MGRHVPGWQIFICVATAVGFIAYSVFWGYGEAHMPLLVAAFVTSIFGVINGWKWSVIEKGMIAGITRSMQANLILLTVGMIVSTWKAAGVIPSLIYYGLNIINPSIFLFTACLLCSIVSLCIGSSYTTAGTMGVALIGIAVGLGIDPAMTAGAVVAGAYFGDKMSPLSDTTNLAPAVAGSNVFEHIKHMIWTVTPAYVIMLVIFLILGRSDAQDFSMELKDVLQSEILNEFVVSPLLILPLVLLLVAVFLKAPVIPVMFGGVVIGCICMGLVQGIPFGDWFSIMHYGYESISTVQLTEDYMVADIVGGGGFDGMLWTVAIVFCSMCFAGALEATGMLGTISASIIKLAKTNGLLVLCVILSCLVMNLLCGDQYLAIIIPGRMYKESFEDRHLKNKNLSRCLEDCATLTSPLIPWNVCGATMTGFLGVPTAQYFKYCYVNFLCPIISVIYGFTGFTIEKMTDEEYEKCMEDRARQREDEARALEA